MPETVAALRNWSGVFMQKIGSGGPGSGDPQQGVVDVGGALQQFQLGILFFGKVRADLLQVNFTNLVQSFLGVCVFQVILVRTSVLRF